MKLCHIYRSDTFFETQCREVVDWATVWDVYILTGRYFSAQSAVGRRREPDDVDSDADEVSDDEFDAFLGKVAFQS